MPILVPADTDVVKRYFDFAVVAIFQRYAFIGDHAVSRRTPQGFAQCARGGRDVIKQSYFPKIRQLSKVKPEKLVRQSVRSGRFTNRI